MTQAQHTPFLPTRTGLPEAVFIARWRHLNAESPSLLPGILGRNRADVRSSRVAASFVTWIGTNAGACFIREAKLRVEEYIYAEPAYLAAWALANRRKRAVSSNVRAIEVILSPVSLFCQSGGTPFELASKLCISLSDLDVIEAVVTWLSTAHGDSFVVACMAEYEANLAREHSMHNIRQEVFAHS